MEMLGHIWLPIVLSAVFVFIASSLINMFLKFWHMPDYHGFSNEDEVRDVLRRGMGEPGMYNLPYCTPERMKDPAMKQKMIDGPLAMVALKPGAPMSMGKPLAQWFAFCLGVSFVCACLGSAVLAPGASSHVVFHTFALAGLLGHASGPFPDAIWWSHRWRSSFKYVIDGLIYALIIGGTFAWLWPA